DAQTPKPEDIPNAPSEIAQLGEAVKAIKDILGDSKDVLENMNRVLISTQRASSTVGNFGDNPNTRSIIHFNPVNQRGVLATVRPRSAYAAFLDEYFPNLYPILLSDEETAGYLKFLGIGSNLIQGGEQPKLLNGKTEEAKTLLLKHIKKGPELELEHLGDTAWHDVAPVHLWAGDFQIRTCPLADVNKEIPGFVAPLPFDHD
ncbi:hypothetical protein FRC11_004608, partial [Ceratobasidium sp. 423]